MASTLRPRRSPGLTRCRLGMRVAAGLSPAQAARAVAAPAASPALLARVARRAGCPTAVGRCLGPVVLPPLPPPGSSGGPSRSGGDSPDRLGGPVEPGHDIGGAGAEPAGLS